MRKGLLLLSILISTLSFLNAQNVYVSEDFNAGTLPTGWSNNALVGTDVWLFGIDGSATENGNNNLDGTNMAYFDDDLAGNGNSNTVELITPSFDNSSAAVTELEFDYNFRQLNGINDSFYVDVFDGANWQRALSVGLNDCGRWIQCAGNYPHASLDISAFANANCQVRFTYFDDNDWGWYVGIDNVVITSPLPNDVQVSEVIRPESGCGLTSTDSVVVKVKNIGGLPASGFDVVYAINGGAPVVETISATIDASDSLVYKFNTRANFSAVGSYDLKTYTNYGVDGNTANDSANVTIINDPVYSPTYNDGFEGPTTEWKVSGNNSSWQRGAPNGTDISSAAAGAQSFVTNLSGVHNTFETSYLTSPCFDFSASPGDPVMSFAFYYETEVNAAGGDKGWMEYSLDNGDTWTKLPVGPNADNWYNNSTAAVWEGNSNGWVNVENVLSGFAGESQVIFRFVFTSDGSINNEGLAVDNFSIRNPQQIDIATSELLYPNSGSAPICGYGNEDIIVEVENKGVNAINQIVFAYQVDNGPIFYDTVNVTLNSYTAYTHTFTSKYDFSNITNYNLDVWAIVVGDNFQFNDSLTGNTISNTSVLVNSIGSSQNFDSPPFRAGTNFSNPGDAIGAGWTRVPDNTSSYSWRVANTAATRSAATGPNADHTTGIPLNGNFIYTEASFGGSGQVAEFISPCVDLSTAAGAKLLFYYHRFGTDINTLFIDVYDGVNWNNAVGTITAQPQTDGADPFTEAVVDISQFVGRRVKVRFRSTSLGCCAGDIAIDDVTIYEPIPQDAKMLGITSPVSGCGLSNNSVVTVEVENFGTDPIAPNSLNVSYRLNNGGIVTETVPQGIAVGASITYSFTQTVNMSQPGTTYELDAWTSLTGDSNTGNDRVDDYFVTNFTKDLSYVENFESFTDGDCANNANANANDVLQRGWQEVSTGSYAWHVHDVALCGGGTGSGGTGPALDHTRGNGKFMFTEGSGASGTALLELPCLDLTNNLGAAMNFWYHKFGGDMGNLHVDVFANNVWNTVLTIPGDEQTAETDPWTMATAKFNQFAGQQVKVRFRAIYGGGIGSDMGIDDISFFEPLPKDAKMVAVTSPTSGCEISANSIVSVEIENFGTTEIKADSMLVFYQINGGVIVEDTFKNNIPVEQIRSFTFAQPADLSIPGQEYIIKVWTQLRGEGDVSNDTLRNYKVINQTKSTNYFEDFESFGDALCGQMIGQVVREGWSANETEYGWHVQLSQCGKNDLVTPTSFTGPSGDHTTGRGVFMYTEFDDFDENGASANTQAVFTTPCIDLSSNTDAAISFWYHKYGNSMGNLRVEAYNNSTGNWVLVGNVSGQTQTSAAAPWKITTFPLTPFVGQFTQVRFIGTRNGDRSDMALDDILIYEPATQDVVLSEIISPSGNSCNLSSQNVTVRLGNFGSQPIAPNTVELRYTNNNKQLTIDTLASGIPVGGTASHTFSSMVDLSSPGRQNIIITARLSGDTLTNNNTLKTQLTNRTAGLPYYFMDFENHLMGTAVPNYPQDFMEGWSRSPNGFGHTWHVQVGAAPTIDGEPMPAPPIPPNGPSGDHTFATPRQNGAGTYMLTETKHRSPQGDAILYLPCGSMDLTKSVNGRVLLSFWYHKFGANQGDLYIDVNDGGAGWINNVGVIRGDVQQDDTDKWREFQMALDNYTDSSNVRIRFRADFLGNVGGGDMGIDDIQILDRIENDVAVKSFVNPQSDCELSNSEDVEIRVQNTGTQDILKLVMTYQITFTPFNGKPVVLDPVSDSVVGNLILPDAFYTFAFDKNRVNMVQPGKYEFKVWANLDGDSIPVNDTLTRVVFNETRPFPSCEDWSDIRFGDFPKIFLEGKLNNNWEGNRGNYAFKASIGGPGGGPVDGHTGGLNDLYMLANDADAGQPGTEARIESPCWDLTSTPAANLEFWYQAPSGSHRMIVEVRRGAGQWTPVDTLFGDPVIGWTKHSTVLTDFVGDFLNVRFLAYSTNAFYAIDDVCIVQPPPQQIELERFLVPQTGLCFYSSSEVPVLSIQNVGSDNIDSFRVVLTVDTGVQKFPAGQYFRDTMWFYPGAAPPFFTPGERLQLALDSFAIDMSHLEDYFFSAYLYLPGDIEEENNFVEDYVVTHGDARDLPYIVDFEDPVDPPNGLQAIQSANYAWALLSGPDRPGETGPNDDHTLQNGNGTYVVTQALTADPLEEVTLFSECIDLSNATDPEMSYWYHMFGFEMGDLYLEINDDFGWVRVDSIKGQVQTNSTRPWQERIVDLSAYAGKFIKFRFISICGGSFSDMALDDINIYDVAPTDILVKGLARPTDAITSCYTDTQSVKVILRNNGSQPIDFSVDTADLIVKVSKDGQPWDTLYKQITENLWKRNGIPQPLPADSILIVTMDSTSTVYRDAAGYFDMSEKDANFKFEVEIDLRSDAISSNDQYETEVVGRLEGGAVTTVQPNDTVCFGTPVKLEVENYFGGLTWETRILTGSDPNSGAWGPAFLGFPTNDSIYVETPDDTTLWYRVNVCNKVVSDSLLVEIKKPYYNGIGINGSRCGDGDVRVGAVVYYNPTPGFEIDVVTFYDQRQGGNVLYQEAPNFNNGATPVDTIWYTDSYTFTGDTSIGEFASNYAMWVETRIDSCLSFDRERVVATVNKPPIVDFGFPAGVTDTTVCQDSSMVFDGGFQLNHSTQYNWTIINPDGSVDTDYDEQTLSIDAWQLEVGDLYKVYLEVVSDSGCTAKASDTISVLIEDSCFVGVNELSLNSYFDLYPNPTNDLVYLEYKASNPIEGDIVLRSMEGKIIERRRKVKLSGEPIEFDLTALSKGIYFIKIETEDATIVRKLIKK